MLNNCLYVCSWILLREVTRRSWGKVQPFYRRPWGIVISHLINTIGPLNNRLHPPNWMQRLVIYSKSIPKNCCKSLDNCSNQILPLEGPQGLLRQSQLKSESVIWKIWKICTENVICYKWSPGENLEWVIYTETRAGTLVWKSRSAGE